LYYAISQRLDVKLATNIVDGCVGLAGCCHCILMGDRPNAILLSAKSK